MEQEIWKDISKIKKYQTLKGKCKVSNLGNVLILKNEKWIAPPKLHLKKGRYLYFNFNNIPFITIHQVVCEIFHGQRPTSDHSPDHINGKHSDNRAENLEWVTSIEQNRRAVVMGKRKMSKKLIVQFTLDGQYVATHENGAIAARAVGKNNTSMIHVACKKLQKTYAGFIWEYAD